MKPHPEFLLSPAGEFDFPGVADVMPAALVKAFENESSIRRSSGRQPCCLFIDSDDDGRNLRMLVQRGDQSNMMVIGAGSCQSGKGCLVADREERAEVCELVPFHLAAVDLTLCRIDLASLQPGVAACLLEQLRGKTRTGGMLFVFVGDPLVRTGSYTGLAHPPTSSAGRDLFNTLVVHGWSVLRTGVGAGGVAFAVAGRP